MMIDDSLSLPDAKIECPKCKSTDHRISGCFLFCKKCRATSKLKIASNVNLNYPYDIDKSRS
jgi:ribosomal protein L37AE/L43A